MKFVSFNKFNNERLSYLHLPIIFTLFRETIIMILYFDEENYFIFSIYIAHKIFIFYIFIFEIILIHITDFNLYLFLHASHYIFNHNYLF